MKQDLDVETNFNVYNWTSMVTSSVLRAQMLCAYGKCVRTFVRSGGKCVRA
jgi:hypothetical protein